MTQEKNRGVKSVLERAGFSRGHLGAADIRAVTRGIQTVLSATCGGRVPKGGKKELTKGRKQELGCHEMILRDGGVGWDASGKGVYVPRTWSGWVGGDMTSHYPTSPEEDGGVACLEVGVK